MEKIGFTFERQRFLPGFDKKTCKICPVFMTDQKGTVILTYQELLLSGSDVVTKTYACKSSDGSDAFSEPRIVPGQTRTDGGVRTVFGTAAGFYSKNHRKWIRFSNSAIFSNDRRPDPVSRAYVSFFDPETLSDSSEPRLLPFPIESDEVVPFCQPFELENGDLMITLYYTPKGSRRYAAVTARYALDGEDPILVKLGEPISVGEEYRRGVCEPSLSRLKGKYYIALRTDEVGMFSVSDDGYVFEKPRPWVWDDGSALENYNTQQRWVRSPEGLFLVYNRRGAHNDHVFRHRAPLFMTRFDEERLCLVRSEEIVVVPELGARLGNLYVTDVSEKESWISVAEWMQPVGCEKYGSDNSIWRTKILFD